MTFKESVAQRAPFKKDELDTMLAGFGTLSSYQRGMFFDRLDITAFPVLRESIKGVLDAIGMTLNRPSNNMNTFPLVTASRSLRSLAIKGVNIDRFQKALATHLSDPERDVRIAALEALSFTGEGAIPAVETCLSDKDDSVVAAALNSVSKLSSAGVNCSRIRKKVFARIGNENQTLNVTAMYAAGTMAAAGVDCIAAVDKVTGQLHSDVPEVKTAALFGVGMLFGPKARNRTNLRKFAADVVVASIGDPSPNVNSTALHAACDLSLSGLDFTRISEKAYDQLRHPKPEVRTAALHYVDAMANPQVRHRAQIPEWVSGEVFHMVRNDDIRIKTSAMGVAVNLVQMGVKMPAHTLEEIRSGVNSHSSKVRCSVAYALGELGDQADVERMSHLLRSHDFHTQWRAAKALLRMNERGINIDGAEDSLRFAEGRTDLGGNAPVNKIEIATKVVRRALDRMPQKTVHLKPAG
ncbi:MAG: HEAT repeat domain-containing protein [Candidatus Altiarchaeota archaeon]|nr:HEAT repeat domain-containing protein [Candidatus Altiarchaeota archaeon]